MSSEITNAAVPPIIKERRGECIFFDEGRIPRPTNIYVCWIDVMGSRSIMLRSLGIASNFIMRLHVAALRVSEQF